MPVNRNSFKVDHELLAKIQLTLFDTKNTILELVCWNCKQLVFHKVESIRLFQFRAFAKQDEYWFHTYFFRPTKLSISLNSISLIFAHFREKRMRRETVSISF